ncbi:MAG: signal peptide peptidase SppA [Bacteroidales bacterium]|nr:signal peptide peptidase SppA [Bacteroidales bacterium]
MKQFFKFMFASMLGFILSWVALFFLIIIITVSIVASTTDKTVSVSNNSILEITLSNEIVERAGKNPIENFDFSSMKSSKSLGLYDITTAIKGAAKDDKIKGIYLNLSDIQSGIASLEEIRNALIEFKESGKFIISYGETYSQKAYYLATVADKIYLNPEGGIDLKGLNASIMFFKGTLAKLEIEPQIIRHGKFKSAIEPYILDKMSPENREQTMRYMGSIWNDMVKKMSESRKISESEINAAADNLLLQFPDEALKLKYVDGLIYKDELLDIFKTKVEAEKIDDLKFVKLESYLNSDGAKASTAKTKDKIAVVYAVGEIAGGEGSDKSIGSERISREIRNARLDENIKAVVLRVNSPGGSALASEVILREVILTKKVKPVVVSMGDVAASGGYYIACHADAIVAQPNTITGSIGVFGMMPNLKKLLNNKLGITIDQVKTNTHADYMNLFRPMDEFEYQSILRSIERIYDVFIGHVAEGRGVTKEYVDSIGQGRVWSGVDAKNLNLVDEIGGLDKAIEIAAKKANLEEYRIQFLPLQKEFFEQLMEETQMAQVSLLQEELGEFYEYYMFLKRTTNDRGIQARLPYLIHID